MLIEDTFIINGVHFEYMPGDKEELGGDDYGVRSQGYSTANGRRIISTAVPAYRADKPYAHTRLIHNQAWTFSWGADSWMSKTMGDYFVNLYKANRPFWIQCDSIMSREFANLTCVDPGTYTIYHTPTYPIVPFGQTPVSTKSHLSNLFVDGVALGSLSGVTIDEEFGIVRFATPLTASNIVSMRYTWRCYVRMKDLKVAEINTAPVQTIYLGNATFEQITPDYTNDPWQTYLPSYEAGDLV